MQQRAQVYAGIVFDAANYLDVSKLLGDDLDADKIDKKKFEEWARLPETRAMIERIFGEKNTCFS